jgi:NADPH2:quinone reductase
VSSAVRIHATGGADVLRWEEVAVARPGPGEVRLRQTAVGVNYIDVYYRSGLYPLAALPATLGMEAAGVIEDVGPGVVGLTAGDRVAYVLGPGAYCEERVLPAARVVKLPAGVSDATAAGMMLKGMTAEYLLRRTYPVKAGDTVLVHAAAGGVGLIACQWASHLGATVIGTVGSPEKAELARSHGCHHPILYREQSFLEEVKRITGGRGVPVVYDSVGRDTFDDSLACLQPRGLLALFGQSSGTVAPFDVARLGGASSLFLTRPSLAAYTATRADLEASARALFDVVESGAVRVEVRHTYPLRDAARAHRDLEGRRTSGSIVLRPDD